MGSSPKRRVFSFFRSSSPSLFQSSGAVLSDIRTAARNYAHTLAKHADTIIQAGLAREFGFGFLAHARRALSMCLRAADRFPSLHGWKRAIGTDRASKSWSCSLAAQRSLKSSRIFLW